MVTGPADIVAKCQKGLELPANEYRQLVRSFKLNIYAQELVLCPLWGLQCARGCCSNLLQWEIINNSQPGRERKGNSKITSRLH